MSGNPQRTYARLAGFMYLFTIAVGLTSLFITSRIEVGRSITETARSVVASEVLYRIGLCLGLAESLCALVLAVSLYVTVKPVDGNLAVMALLFRLVEVATGAAGAGVSFATLQLYVDVRHASGFDPNQLTMLVDLSSVAGGTSGNVALISFSIGSTIFFLLFLRSGYIPRLLSVWGMFGSVVFAVVGITNLVLPQYSSVATVGYAPIAIAEITTGLWLLVRGVRIRPEDESDTTTPAREPSVA